MEEKLFLVKNKDADCMVNFIYFIVKSKNNHDAIKSVVDLMNFKYEGDHYKMNEFTCVEINNNLFIGTDKIFVIK